MILGSTTCAHLCPRGETTITILHTNDIHARYLPHEAPWVSETPRPLIGGFARLSEVMDSVRRGRPITVTLDAGDVMTGNPIADRLYRGAQGGLLIELMNMIGYDAWSPGNHEFDISQENMRALVAVASFPSLAANLAESSGEQYHGTQPYTILSRGGLRIGVIGLISQRLSSLVLQRNLTGIRVHDPTATLERWVKELDPVTDLLIVLTHQGYAADSVLAEESTGVDIIVGGHSHTRLREPRLVNGVLIVQAGSYCESLGVLTVTVRDDRVSDFWGQLLPLWVTGPPRQSPVARLADSVRTVIDKEYGEVILTLGHRWRKNDPEQRLLIAVTEAQRTAASAEVAFMNRGGIRRDLEAGPVTRRDLYEAIPFRNVLGTFQLSGAELRDVLVYVLDRETDVVVTGLTADWRRTKEGGVELLRVMIGGAPMEDDSAYRCTASDYFLSQFSRYCGREQPTAAYPRLTVFEAVEQFLRQDGIQEQVPPPGINRR